MYIFLGMLCNQQKKCNCSLIKKYNSPLNLSCVDSNNDCTWYHILNNSSVPIEEKFRTNNSNTINLLGYYDNESYGQFIAINSSNDSCYYWVVPPLDDGTGI